MIDNGLKIVVVYSQNIMPADFYLEKVVEVVVEVEEQPPLLEGAETKDDWLGGKVQVSGLVELEKVGRLQE